MIYVLGHKGRLGRELVRRGVETIDVDITDSEKVNDALGNLTKGDVVINCAAYTNVDACETKEGTKQSIRINTRGVYNLLNVPFRKYQLFHISTDYVFPCNRGPYKEMPQRNLCPVNAYGWSKWGGEIVYLMEHKNGDSLIRTTGLFGNSGNDFASMIANKLTSGEQVLVTNELYGNQTYIPFLADQLIFYARMDKSKAKKIIHLASTDVMSRYEFALEIAKIGGYSKSLITPCKNDEVPGWVANRPTEGGLKMGHAKKIFDRLYTVLDGLEVWVEK